MGEFELLTSFREALPKIWRRPVLKILNAVGMPLGDSAGLVRGLPGDGGLATFATHHLADMIQDLRETYYRQWKAAKPDAV
jgi:hypothetical protein